MPVAPGEVIAGRLTSSAALTALVSQRIYPYKPNQDDTGDYVVYMKVSGGGGVRLDGLTGTKWYQFRVEAYAVNDAKSEAIRQAVTLALDGWVDQSIGVVGCFAQEDQDGQTAEDAAGSVYQISGQTFGIWYRG